MLRLSEGSLFLCPNHSNFLSLAKENLMFKILAKINKLFLPSFTKRGLDMAKAKKWQLALIGWRYYVTKKALGN